MTVAVVGGTGTLGSLIVADLLGRGESVIVLSRGGEGVPAGAEHRRVDLAAGEGLDHALAGVSAVVDASNSQRSVEKTLVDGTRRLLAAGAAAAVTSHVAISIVGCDQVPIRYYRAKVAQEGAVETGPVPWTLLRATQFHQLLDSWFTTAARFGVRPTGAAQAQPIDPTVVAGRLADAALAAPAGRLPDLGGPRTATLGELSHAWAMARGRRCLPLRVPAWGRIGRPLAAGALCAAGAGGTGEDFEEWLRHE
jgi:uncharacterized protein YbjT (DUF2867 family)